MNHETEIGCLIHNSSTVEILRELGRGESGIVYLARVDNFECALKVFYNGRAYRKECRAYNTCEKIEALNGRLPAYRGSIEGLPPTLSRKSHHYHRMISIDLVPGRTLNKCIESVPMNRLGELQNSLLCALQMMHDQAGVCHGDVQGENIVLQRDDGRADSNRTVLLDLSQACFKTDLDPLSWESRKQRDYEMLRSMFADAQARLATKAALALIDASVAEDHHLQTKLASLINAALPSPRLLTAIRAVKLPIPALALSIAGALSRSGKRRTALNWLESYIATAPPKPRDQDKRFLMQLRGEWARHHALCSLSVGINSYLEVIAECAKTLGATDNYTLSLRFAYARCLRTEGQRRVDVVKTYLQMLCDLHGLYKRKPPDLSYTDEQSTPATVADAWTRRLVSAVRETLKEVEDQDVLAQAQRVLGQVTTPSVELHATEQPVTGQQWKRKFGTVDVNAVDGLVVTHNKRAKRSTE